MDGGKLIRNVQTHSLHDLVHHSPAVQQGELLHNPHVVQVLLQQAAGNIGQMPRHRGALGVFQDLQLLLNLFRPALGLQPGNQPLLILPAAAVQRR